MPSEHDPQATGRLRDCARHLVQQPLTCKEHDPELFRLIRRHEAELDRWFTQRLGYRLHVDADTARLFKVGAVPAHRPLRTRTGRAFHPLEYVLLALVLGSTAAGPAVISLRDLVEQVRSAAVEADIALEDAAATRRALVAVLQWMIERGLASELHAQVDAYAGDDTVDAVLKLRPDRIVLVSLPALTGATDADELLQRAERRDTTRQWMRCRLVEEPVLYRTDLTETEWSELRRRLGEEERLLEEMFGLVLEARAEGVAAIDPPGTLAEQPFPTGGTLGHAALLLLAALRDHGDAEIEWAEVLRCVESLAAAHARGWSNDLVAAPERLARRIAELLVGLRLAEWVRPAEAEAGEGQTAMRVLPAAGRFLPIQPDEASESSATERDTQATLW
jgi:uncharacterized protein (TIGR02678 family)